MNKLQITIIICAITFSACRKEVVKNEVNQTISANITKIKTAVASNQETATSIDVLAVVVSELEAKPSFKTGGIIQRTYFKEGEQVRKGQLLATLHLDEINAQLKQAEEGLSKSIRDMQRAVNLHRDSVATLEQVQNATTVMEVMKNNVEVIKFNKRYSEVRSSISGKVIKKLIHDGEVIGPGMPVCVLMGNSTKDWKVKAGLTDRDWAAIKKGDKAYLSLDAYPGKKFELLVHEKSVIGGNASGTIDVDFKFVNQPSDLAAGLVGKVVIPFNKNTTRSFLYIPLDALIETSGNQAFVFLIEQQTARKTSIEIGKIIGSNIQVYSGIKEGQKVATTGAAFLEDGDKVIEE